MKRIEKMFKVQADSILPTDKLKQNVKNTVIGSNTVSQSAPKKQVRFNWKIAAASLCLIVAIIIGFVSQSLLLPQSPSNSYVSIDINPSFEIIADADDKVISVNALNQDAVLVLFNKNFVGQPLEVVCQTIVKLSAELGYVKENAVVNVTAVNDSGKKETILAENLNSSLTQFIQNSLLKASVQVNSDVVGEIAQKYNITQGRAKLIQQAIERLQMNYEQLSKLSNSEINQLLKNYNKSEIDAESALINEYFAQQGYGEQLNEIKVEIDQKEELVKYLEKYVDWLEDFSDGKGSEQAHNEKLKEFKSKFPQLSVSNNVKLDDLIELVESERDSIEEKIDHLDESLEKAEIEAKNKWKNDSDRDEVDDDDSNQGKDDDRNDHNGGEEGDDAKEDGKDDNESVNDNGGDDTDNDGQSPSDDKGNKPSEKQDDNDSQSHPTDKDDKQNNEDGDEDSKDEDDADDIRNPSNKMGN